MTAQSIDPQIVITRSNHPYITVDEEGEVMTIAPSHFNTNAGPYHASTKTSVRGVVVDGEAYRVEYTYDPNVGSVPAVYGAVPHYQACIEVFLINSDLGRRYVGSTTGIYTETGCCDNVETWVRQALRNRSEQGLPPVEVRETGPQAYMLGTHEITSTNWVDIPDRKDKQVGLIEKTWQITVRFQSKTNVFTVDKKVVGTAGERDTPQNTFQGYIIGSTNYLLDVIR